MSSAIKAMIQHQAALAQIDEMHRQAAARTRLHVPARTNRHQSGRRTLTARADATACAERRKRMSRIRLGSATTMERSGMAARPAR